MKIINNIRRIKQLEARIVQLETVVNNMAAQVGCRLFSALSETTLSRESPPSARARSMALRSLDLLLAYSSPPAASAQSASNLDFAPDTAEKGELDALAMIEQGSREDFGKRVDSWNFRNQATPHSGGE